MSFFCWSNDYYFFNSFDLENRASKKGISSSCIVTRREKWFGSRQMLKWPKDQLREAGTCVRNTHCSDWGMAHNNVTNNKWTIHNAQLTLTCTYFDAFNFHSLSRYALRSIRVFHSKNERLLMGQLYGCKWALTTVHEWRTSNLSRTNSIACWMMCVNS